MTFVPATQANADTVCQSIFQFEAPSGCVLSDAEGAILGTPNITTCNDRFAGLVLSTGYDSAVYVAFTGIGLDGQLTPGASVRYSIWLMQDCRAWAGAYSVTLKLSGDSGGSVTSTPIGQFAYSEKFTGALDSYCFTNTCGSTTYSGTFTIPPSLAVGQYRVQVSVDYNAASALLPLPALHQDVVMKTKLTKTQFYPAVNLYFPDGGPLVCYFLDFTKAAVQTYGITGTDWEIKAGNQVIATYKDLPLYSDTRFSKYLSTGAFTIDLNTTAGVPVYGFGIKAQTKGQTYTCSVSVKTTQGAYDKVSLSATAAVSTLNWTVIPEPSSRTITCYKRSNSKLTKKVTGVNPKCPSGYSTSKS